MHIIHNYRSFVNQKGGNAILIIEYEKYYDISEGTVGELLDCDVSIAADFYENITRKPWEIEVFVIKTSEHKCKAFCYVDATGIKNIEKLNSLVNLKLDNSVLAYLSSKIGSYTSSLKKMEAVIFGE